MVIVYSPVEVVGSMVTVTVEVPTPCAGASWAGENSSRIPSGLPLAVRLMLDENWPIGFTETSAVHVSPRVSCMELDTTEMSKSGWGVTTSSNWAV